MAGRLEGKVAIITGGSRGLGEYCAIGYGREGAKVAVAARTEQQKVEELPGTIYDTAKQVEAAGGEALPVVCNVADEDSVRTMVEKVLEKWGRVDILMNNAAVQPPGNLQQIAPKHWQLEFQVNVHGPFFCARAVLPSMLEHSSGNIINISSVAARGGSHYGITKRALEGFTIGLAQETRRNGVAVNTLKPVGGIDTPGLYYRGPGVTRPRRERGSEDDLNRESYVEAAILLAMQTPETCTGQTYNDAEAIEALADDETKKRFRTGERATARGFGRGG